MKLCQLIYPPPSPHLMGGGVQTSVYTSGTINGQGYALIFPQMVTVGTDNFTNVTSPANQNSTASITVTIDGISASYLAYRIFQGHNNNTNGYAWGELSQGGPETLMFTKTFSATGSFQKIIIYLYT